MGPTQGVCQTTSSPGWGWPERMIVPSVRPRKNRDVCRTAVAWSWVVRAYNSVSGVAQTAGASRSSSTVAKPRSPSTAMTRPTMRRGLGVNSSDPATLGGGGVAGVGGEGTCWHALHKNTASSENAAAVFFIRRAAAAANVTTSASGSRGRREGCRARAGHRWGWAHRLPRVLREREWWRRL